MLGCIFVSTVTFMKRLAAVSYTHLDVYKRQELAEKVSRGHKENALKAKFNGGPVPLGYRIDSEHHYQIDPTTAPVVQEAFQRYAAGESIRSIICLLYTSRCV